MTATPKTSAPLPPRWFVRLAWVAHRPIYRKLDVCAVRRSRPTQVVVLEPLA